MKKPYPRVGAWLRKNYVRLGVTHADLLVCWGQRRWGTHQAMRALFVHAQHAPTSEQRIAAQIALDALFRHPAFRKNNEHDSLN